MTRDGAMFSVEIPGLTQKHLDALRTGSGLSLDVIQERGYRTVLGKQQLADAGFAPSQRRPPGLLLPAHTADGSNTLSSYRPDVPRVTSAGKELKYELPRGMTARLDVPTRSKEGIKDPSIELWFTEGQKKSDALVTHGLCAVALLGVWNFKGKNEFGGVTLLSDFDEIALNRVINIVFDSDVMTKPPVRAALDRLTEHLQRRGATVNAVYLPGGSDGKVGVDDYLLTHTSDELKALVQQPATAPKAAVPTVELLDGAPQYFQGHWPLLMDTRTQPLGFGPTPRLRRV